MTQMYDGCKKNALKNTFENVSVHVYMVSTM